MNTQALITAGETVFKTVSGKTISASVESNITDIGSLVTVGLSLLERNTEFNVSGVVDGLTQILSGVNTTVQAAKTKAVNASASTGGA
ncbi:hypothetical protein HK16_01080 [Acetobacter senegalensis]|uniref:Uncharacterized protein n=2 Tax=Acetobacter TaxID=434 RepID=A0A252EEI9_9PROT|nr:MULTISPECIES: hypothetical protein [Acetobacter]ATJ90461.1 hypothetical protein CIW82_06910 [Acetobacter tropicalis]MCC6106006.1 hypothetical protein [Acetobacter sp.]MCG4254266.1 hypothetical protein [Acetobacter senegalensis]MCG4258218.1 hypothetical protein [Acetobacter senegalensis]MCG4268145.1 hypothetical protein [Acetobacter senegalensis]